VPVRAAVLAATTVLLATTAACGGSGGADVQDDGDGIAAAAADPTTATVEPSSRPCGEERHMVVFDFFGSLNGGISQAAAWLGDAGTPPIPRPGAADVANAYRERGYEILYLTLLPAETRAGGVPIADAVQAWLAANGFPQGDGTSVWTWDGQGDSPQVRAIDQLILLGTEGVSLDAAYTDNVDKANTFISGGVPADHLYTLDAAEERERTVPIPGSDLVAHARTLQSLERVCQPV
jgi:hypothetical protein